jgi:formamidopyrimidine-DNA glycosylase
VITVLAVLLTWYVTKVYYTRSFQIEVDNLEKHDLTEARCSRCSHDIVTHEENLRSPFYCMLCK